MKDIKTLRRENRELKKSLRDLVVVITSALADLDAEMGKSSSPERGGRIAKICNAIQLQRDMSVRYGLGIKEF